MTSVPPTIDKLISGMETLPREIFDMIEDLVLSVDDEPYVRVLDRKYQQPAQMQLNRKIRSELVNKYYGDGAVWSTLWSYLPPQKSDYLSDMWQSRPSVTAPRGSFARWANSRSDEVKRILGERQEANMFFSRIECYHHWHILSSKRTIKYGWPSDHLLPIYCECTRYQVLTGLPNTQA